MGQRMTSQATGYFANAFDAELVSTQGLAFDGESAAWRAEPAPSARLIRKEELHSGVATGAAGRLRP